MSLPGQAELATFHRTRVAGLSLCDGYLCYKSSPVEPELPAGANLRLDRRVTRPPLTNSVGRRDRLIDSFRGRVNLDQLHDVRAWRHPLPSTAPPVAAAGRTAMLAPSPACRSHSRRDDIRPKRS